MITLDTIGSIIDEFTDNYGLKVGIEYRLPAPIASTSVYDRLWSELVRVHPWHKHPKQILDSARSVIVFAIPLSYSAVKSNEESSEPSVQWLREYILTNKLIEEVAKYISSILKSHGYRSLGLKPTHNYKPDSLVSEWSHRHAGYVCGLGTFGLNNLLITSKGCAVRLGTVITEAEVEVSEKPRYEYCLERRGVKCKICIKRCPIRALDNWSYGRFKCSERLSKIALKYIGIIGEYADACGKCCTGVPCATGIP